MQQIVSRHARSATSAPASPARQFQPHVSRQTLMSPSLLLANVVTELSNKEKNAIVEEYKVAQEIPAVTPQHANIQPAQSATTRMMHVVKTVNFHPQRWSVELQVTRYVIRKKHVQATHLLVQMITPFRMGLRAVADFNVHQANVLHAIFNVNRPSMVARVLVTIHHVC
jgi:hypothetical protein